MHRIRPYPPESLSFRCPTCLAKQGSGPEESLPTTTPEKNRVMAMRRLRQDLPEKGRPVAPRVPSSRHPSSTRLPRLRASFLASQRYAGAFPGRPLWEHAREICGIFLICFWAWHVWGAVPLPPARQARTGPGWPKELQARFFKIIQISGNLDFWNLPL